MEALRDQYNAAETAWRLALDTLAKNPTDEARASESTALANVERLALEYGRAKRAAYRATILGVPAPAGWETEAAEIKRRLDALEGR